MDAVNDEPKVVDFSYQLLLVDSDDKVIDKITITSKISLNRADSLITMFGHLLEKYEPKGVSHE